MNSIAVKISDITVLVLSLVLITRGSPLGLDGV